MSTPVNDGDLPAHSVEGAAHAHGVEGGALGFGVEGAAHAHGVEGGAPGFGVEGAAHANSVEGDAPGFGVDDGAPVHAGDDAALGFGIDGLLAPAPTISCPTTRKLLLRAIDVAVGAHQIPLLAKVQVSRLNEGDRLAFLEAWHRALNWASGQYQRAVAAAAGAAQPPDADMPHEEQRYSVSGNMAEDSRIAEIGASLHLSAHAAYRLVEAARTAVTITAPVLEHVDTGLWNMAHLRAAQDAVSAHPEQLATQAVQRAVATSSNCSPRQLKQRIQRELVRLDSKATTRRVKAAKRDRSVALWAEDDFRGELACRGTWSALSTTYQQLTRRAEHMLEYLRAYRRSHPTVKLCCPDAVQKALYGSQAHCTSDSPGANSREGSAADSREGSGADPRADLKVDSRSRDDHRSRQAVACVFCGSTSDALPTLEQLRADALIEAGNLLEASMADAKGKDWALKPVRGARWRYAIVVTDLATALGVCDEPGWVPGYGYVPAEISRELLADAQMWQKFLIDAQGQLSSVGKYSYRPSQRLREMVTARDLTCTFPGCARSAATADLDHRVNFDGTNTEASNLHALCRTHHRLKTYLDWKVHRDHAGVDHWTSPIGRHYRSNPGDPPWGKPVESTSPFRSDSSSRPDSG